MLAAAVRRLEATKSFRPIHTVTLNARGYAIGILNDQLIKKEKQKKRCASLDTLNIALVFYMTSHAYIPREIEYLAGERFLTSCAIEE